MIETRDAWHEVRRLLAESALFSGLSGPALDRLAAMSRLLQVGAGSAVVDMGMPTREAFLLLRGSVRRFTRLAGEAEKVIELAQPAQLLGLGEVFGSAAYAAACESLTDCLLVAVDRDTLAALMREDQGLAGRVLEALARRLYAVEFDVTGYHYGLTGAQRVLDYLVELAGGRTGLAGETTVTLKAGKKMIAARVGMTPESFSRCLRLLSDKGVIVVEGRSIHIQNAALLDTDRDQQGQRVSFRRRRKLAEGARDGPTPGEVVNLCGSQRQLSQRIALLWAMVAREVSASRAAARLDQHCRLFERHLVTLEELSWPDAIGAQLGVVRRLWTAYHAALCDAPPAMDEAPRLLELSEEMLAATDRLTQAVEAGMASPEAHYVNVAGRNRMILQRVMKFTLFRRCADCQEDMAACCVAEAHAEFERNLAELRRSGAGIPELQAQLTVVEGEWQALVDAMARSALHAAENRRLLALVAQGDALLRHLDTAVKLYERLAR